MSTSQNGFPALSGGSTLLHTWVIPAKTGTAKIRLRNGSAGFILAHVALWLAEAVDPLVGRVLDDWGYAFRPVRGYTTTLSNHASGTAMDLNATEHPLGKRNTWGTRRARLIRDRLRWRIYSGAVRWGEDYTKRADGMHFEIDKPLSTCEKVARRLMKTPRGRRLLKANPGQKEVILS